MVSVIQVILCGEALSGRFVSASEKRGFPDGDSLETNHIVPSLHFTLISLWLCSTPSSCARCWRMALLLVPVRILSVPSIGSQFGFAFQAWYLCCFFPISFMCFNENTKPFWIKQESAKKDVFFSTFGQNIYQICFK